MNDKQRQQMLIAMKGECDPVIKSLDTLQCFNNYCFAFALAGLTALMIATIVKEML